MSGKRKQDHKMEDNATVVNRLRRLEQRCSVCPPNRGENRTRRPKRGARPPKSKNRPTP